MIAAIDDAADTGQDAGGTETPLEKPKADKKPDPIGNMAHQLALAEAMKPLEGAVLALYSEDADKVAARRKLNDAYKEAAKPGGALQEKFKAAAEKFDRTVLDMDRDPQFGEWITKRISSGAIHEQLATRKALASDYEPKLEPNDKARTEAKAKYQRLADAFADWSAPLPKIEALIGKYAGKIDQLNADINNNNNADSALTAFWFEVAPIHLQLTETLKPGVKSVVQRVKDALGEYPDIAEQIRAEHGPDARYLRLVPAADLQKTRIDVLESWRIAAVALAEAEAKFKLDPDDAATLKKAEDEKRQRYDKLKGDGWIAEARKQLETPTP